MIKLIPVILLLGLIGCSSHPKLFSKNALDEKLVTINRDSISFKEILLKNKNAVKFIQLFTSYCPVSQNSFRDVLKYQQENPEVSYIFLSVDHTFHDWKKGLEYIKPKGQFYYMPKKGKGALGNFLKLKSVPRFLIIDKSGTIKIFKSSKITEKLK